MSNYKDYVVIQRKLLLRYCSPILAKNKGENGKGVSYRIVLRSGRIGGEDNGERGDEEEGEHGGNEDPVREETPEAQSTDTRSPTAPASSDSGRHRIKGIISITLDEMPLTVSQI